MILGKKSEQRRVEISFLTGFTPTFGERLMVVIDALASMLEVEPELIIVRDVGQDGIELELAAETAQQLWYLLKSNNPQLRLLKVSRVVLDRELGRREAWSLTSGRFQRAELPQPTVEDEVESVPVQLFRPLLVALMVVCVAWAMARAIHEVAPTHNVIFLTLACALAAVAAGYSHQIVRARRMLSDDVLKFRIFEFIMLFIVLRFASYIGDGWAAAWADLKNWPHQPLLIFESETMVAFILAIIAWFAAAQVAKDWDRLGEPPERAPLYRTPLDSLANLFFWGGGFLLVISGLTLVMGSLESSTEWNFASVVSYLRRPTSSVSVALNILFYFLLGFVTLSQVRLSSLHIRWREEGIPVDEKLDARWTRASVLLILLPILLALLLPTGYSFGFLGLFRTAFITVISVLVYAAGMLLFLGLSLIAGLFSWLFGTTTDLPQRVRPEPLSLAQAVQQTQAPADWVILMRTVLFWALIAAGLYYVTRTFLHGHPEIRVALRNFRPLATLRRWWQLFRAWFRHWRRNLELRLPRFPQRGSDGPAVQGPRPFRFLRLGALSSRQRILYYYWSTLRRAHKQGLGRRPPQTPHEYRNSLEPHLSGAAEPVSELTKAFMEARYSQHPIQTDREKEIRVHWRSVKKALQERTKQTQEQNK